MIRRDRDELKKLSKEKLGSEYAFKKLRKKEIPIQIRDDNREHLEKVLPSLAKSESTYVDLIIFTDEEILNHLRSL